MCARHDFLPERLHGIRSLNLPVGDNPCIAAGLESLIDLVLTPELRGGSVAVTCSLRAVGLQQKEFLSIWRL